MTPARVVHVAESAGWAGGERYLLALATELDRKRFTLAVLVPGEGPLVARLRELDVETAPVALDERLVSPATFLGLVRALERLRPAIVQSHGARSNVYTRQLAREWSRAGHDVTVLSQEPDPGAYDLGGAKTVRPDVGGRRLTRMLSSAWPSVS